MVGSHSTCKQLTKTKNLFPDIEVRDEGFKIRRRHPAGQGSTNSQCLIQRRLTSVHAEVSRNYFKSFLVTSEALLISIVHRISFSIHSTAREPLDRPSHKIPEFHKNLDFSSSGWGLASGLHSFFSNSCLLICFWNVFLSFFQPKILKNLAVEATVFSWSPVSDKTG